MKYNKIEDQLLDLYDISKIEARLHWQTKLYVDVLKDKIKKATKLNEKLVNIDMMIRDDQRIKRVCDSINFNSMLLEEIGITLTKGE